MSDQVTYNIEKPIFFSGYKHWKDVAWLNRVVKDSHFCFVLSLPIDVLVQDATALCMFRTDSSLSLHYDCLLDIMLYMIGAQKNEFATGADKPSKIVFLEILKNKDPKIQIAVGYRLWFFVSSGFNAGAELEALINENREYIEQERNGTLKKKRKPYKYHQLTSKEDLMKWLQTKNKIEYGQVFPQIDTTTLNHANNPINPLRSFNIEIGLHGIPDIDPRQADVSQYVVLDQDQNPIQYKFPDTHCLYRLTHSQTEIDAFRRMQLPLPFEEEKYDDSKDYSTMKRLMDATPDHIQAIAQSIGIQMNFSNRETQTKSLFNSTIGAKNETAAKPVTAYSLYEENTKARLDIVTQINKLKKEGIKSETEIQQIYENKMDDFYKKALTKWPAVWSEFGNNSSTVKRAVKWLSDYTENGKKSIYQKFGKMTKNLSYFSDFRISFRQYLEVIYKCSTAHEQTEIAWLGVMNSYDADPKNKMHILQTGTAAVSKSYTLDLVESLCIPAAIDVFTYKTLKADAAAGDFDESTEFFHEAPYAWLGVPTNSASGSGKGSGSSSVRTEEEAMMKDELTRGEMSLREVYFDEHHVRHSRTIIRKKNGIKILNTNVAAHEVSEALASRLFISDFHDRRRPDRNIVDVICDVQNLEFKNLKKLCTDRFRRIHALVIMVNYLIKCGILAPVATPISNIIFKETLKRAELMGVPKTNAPRSIARMLCVVRVMVIVRAILIHFSSPLSKYQDPSAGFHVEQLVKLGPQLIDDDISIAAGVFGLMQRQYYDDLQFDIIECIKSHFLNVLDPSKPDNGDPFVLASSGEHTQEEKQKGDQAIQEALKQVVDAQMQQHQQQEQMKMQTGSDTQAHGHGRGQKRRLEQDADDVEEVSDSSRPSAREHKDADGDIQVDQASTGPTEEKSNAKDRKSKQRVKRQKQEEDDRFMGETNEERQQRLLERTLRKKYLATTKDTNQDLYYFIGNLFHTDDNADVKLTQLCYLLQQHMHPPRRFTEIHQRLSELMKLDVSIKDPNTLKDKHIRALQFFGTGIYIAVSTCETNTRNKLRKALEHTLQYRYTIKRRLLFATKSDTKPYMYEHFDIAPTDRKFVIPNINYYDGYMVQMIQSCLLPSDPQYGRLNEIFPDNPINEFTQNLEEFYWKEHVKGYGRTGASLEKDHIYPDRILTQKLVDKSYEEMIQWDKDYRYYKSEARPLLDKQIEIRLNGKKPLTRQEWHEQRRKEIDEYEKTNHYQPSEEQIEEKIGKCPLVDPVAEIQAWLAKEKELKSKPQQWKENEILEHIGMRPLELGEYPECVDMDERKEKEAKTIVMDGIELQTTSSLDAKSSASGSDSSQAIIVAEKPKRALSMLQQDQKNTQILGLSSAYDLDMRQFPFYQKQQAKRNKRKQMDMDSAIQKKTQADQKDPKDQKDTNESSHPATNTNEINETNETKEKKRRKDNDSQPLTNNNERTVSSHLKPHRNNRMGEDTTSLLESSLESLSLVEQRDRLDTTTETVEPIIPMQDDLLRY